MPSGALDNLPTEIVVIVLALLLALALLGWSLYTLLYGPRARLKRRMAQVFGTAPRSSKSLKPGQHKRKSIQTRLKQADEGRAKKRGYRLREELFQAGLRIEVWQYLAANAALALAAGGLWMLIGMGGLGALLVALLVGVGLPKLVVSRLATRRVKRFTAQFSDSLDIIVRGIRSGLPLGECINIIGREMADPMGAEFRLVAEGQKIGLTLSEALDRAVERMPTNELKYFAIVLNIQQQTGGNLAETLAKLSEVLRARKRMRDKSFAMAAEARASALIIGSLPIFVTVVLSFIAPDYIGLLFTTEVGRMILFGGGMMMAGGWMVMRKMIDFDI